MKIIIGVLPPDADVLAQVEALRKSHSATLGFLPEAALQAFLEKRLIIGARDEDDNNKVAGYLLYYKNAEMVRITHLCVGEAFKRQGIARAMFRHLVDLSAKQKRIVLNCRREYEAANSLWRSLGFAPIDEKPGRAQAGSTLTQWCYILRPDDQLSLFQSEVSDETLDAVVDAQIFFHWAGDTSGDYTISESLNADFMSGVVQFWITEELFNEINRNEDEAVRGKNRQYAGGFTSVERSREFSRSKAERFEEMLKEILPGRVDGHMSDIKHLAAVAASDIDIFVTLDGRLLSKKDVIEQAAGVKVMHPTALILQCYAEQARGLYHLSRVTGGLAWDRLSGADIDGVNFGDFVKSGEKMSDLKRAVQRYLSRPDAYTGEILKKAGDNTGIRVFEKKSEGKEKLIHIARLKAGGENRIHSDFLAGDVIYRAIQENCEIVRFSKSGIAPDVERGLDNAGFMERGEEYIKFCLPRCAENIGALESKMSAPLPDWTLRDIAAAGHDIERVCSPADLGDKGNRYFVVPIRPEYAMHLFNRNKAAANLFGADNKILFRPDNVYYRAKRAPNTLQLPAKILWYETTEEGAEGEATAISRLREVTVGKPGELFRKYKRFGVFEWRDIYALCGQDTEREIMALHFTDTFLFRKPVDLAALQEIGINFFQTMSEIDRDKFVFVYNKGFWSP